MLPRLSGNQAPCSNLRCTKVNFDRLSWASGTSFQRRAETWCAKSRNRRPPKVLACAWASWAVSGHWSGLRSRVGVSSQRRTWGLLPQPEPQGRPRGHLLRRVQHQSGAPGALGAEIALYAACTLFPAPCECGQGQAAGFQLLLCPAATGRVKIMTAVAGAKPLLAATCVPEGEDCTTPEAGGAAH